MGDVLSKGSLFPEELVTDLIDKTKGKSVLAALSAQKPIKFNGEKEFIFSMDNEIDVVAENGKKSHGGISLEPVTVVPIKVEYGARISDEFLYASEEEKIDVLKNFNEGFAKKLAKGIDIMAIHGFNPRTGAPSAVIGTNSFAGKVLTKVEYDSADPDTNVEDAIAAIRGEEYDVTGLALSETMRSDLSKMKDSTGRKLYPELSWGREMGNMNGLPTASGTTVNYNGSPIRGLTGDFETCFKWGYSKKIPMEIIKYGDPDNSGKDLKGYNQVYIRCEAYVGWGILIPESFALIVKTLLGSLTVDANISATTDLLGKSVTNLQSGIVVGSDSVSGTLKYVTDYTGFSGDVSLQSGNYLALHYASDEDVDSITVELLGGSSGPVTLDDDGLHVLRITDPASQSIKVTLTKGSETATKTYSLAGLVLQNS